MMQKRGFSNILLGLLCLGVLGCTRDGHSGDPQPIDSTATSLEPHFCGKAVLEDVQSDRSASVGLFELQNDSAFLWVTFTPGGGLTLESLSVFAGEAKDCPHTPTGDIDPERFPIKALQLHQEKPWAARIPLVQLPPCTFVAAKIVVKDGDSTYTALLKTRNQSSSLQGMLYCIQDCRPSAIICDLSDSLQWPRTVPQAEWKAADSPIAAQLTAAWGSLFPSGIRLGCNQLLKFETAEEALANLPMTGKPGPLPATLPTANHVDNLLAGELLTLDLAMALDRQFQDFAPSKLPLGAFLVNKGAFEGWSLQEIFEEGNNVLGSCTSNYTGAQIAEVLQQINESFAVGGPVGDYLHCPTE